MSTAIQIGHGDSEHSLIRGIKRMVYNNKRSKEATERRKQKRAAHEYILKASFNDKLIHETISRTEAVEVQTFLGVSFGFCDMSCVPLTFGGLVLQNDYGHGSFQQ